MLPAPFTQEEFDEATAQLKAAEPKFTTNPMTVRGVDYDDVFELSNMSVRDLFAFTLEEGIDDELLVYGDDRYTKREAWARAMRFANWLVDVKGVTPGQRVAIAMRNYPEWCIAYLGIVAAGATVVPMNAWWQADELRQGLERADAKIIVVDAKRAKALAPCHVPLGLTFVGAREEVPEADITLEEIMADDSLSEETPPVTIDPDSDFCLLYTSGSTGKPKGALLTHRGCINAILSWSFLLNAAQIMRPEFPFKPEKPAVLLALPLFHVTASHSVFLLSFLTGRKMVFLYRWDAIEAGRLIEKEQITNFIGVPTMAHDLVDQVPAEQLASLTDLSTGGAKRPENQLRQQADQLEGKAMSSGYGLTETNALGTHISLADYLERPSSAGKVVPPVSQIEAFDEEGNQLTRGETGEICIKSPATFRAYLDDEAATEAAYHPNGWFRTGDLGYLDDEGFVFIVDRKKDIIIRGGENISCLEVENALLGVEGVDEASVFSVPDEHMGEIVGAVIYSRDETLDAKEVRDLVARELAAFKVPERIWVSPLALPRGTTGKVDKRMIRTVSLDHPPAFKA